MSFEPGMNLLLGDNEFGKSTILSFIRAMFYGFSSRSSARIRDNDRRKFTPWNGRTFGGSIEFQHEGRTYLLEKTFSKRRADDKVSLTLLPSGQKMDPTQKEVGDYLFAISEAEFINTVFVGQLSSNILTTDKETDDISTRLANLADTGSELYSHEEIKSRLISASSKLLALRGSGGLITRLEEELGGLQQKEAELEISQEQAEILRREIAVSLEKQKQLREELFVSSCGLEDRKKLADTLTADLQKQKIILETALQKKRMDQEQAAANAEIERTRIAHLQQREEMRRQLSEEDARAQEEINRLSLNNRQEREKAAAVLTDLDVILKNKEIMCRENKALHEEKVKETRQLEEEILAFSSEIKKLIQTREEVRKGYTTFLSYKFRARRYEVLFLSVYAVCMAAFAVLHDPVMLTGNIFLVFAGVLIISNIMQRRVLEKKIVEMSLIHEAKLKIYENAAAAQYDRQTAFDDCEKQRQELLAQRIRLLENEKKDELFAAQLTALAQERLSACRARAAQFEAQSGELQSGEVQTPEMSAAKSAADSGIDPLMQVSGEEVDVQAREMMIKALEKQLSDVHAGIELLLQQEEKLRTDITASRVDVARKETSRENLLSLEPDLSWLLEQRTLLTERLTDAKAYHRALLTAQSVLDEAFSEMENFFAPQVNEKAGEYFAKLTEGVYSTIHVDRSFGIDIASEGAYSFHKTDFFSGGTVDQIYFALRLAIADLVSSSDDKMPLLLDDAFVQYDDKRAKAGLILLDELSLHRQIVLFTCHNRMGELNETIKKDKGSKSV